ncbi:MAG: hypothetical protein LWX07_09680 [Bacteroidetes bacterium]|nr:hypothetical protein [Bacteroidota bacterium]
MSNSCMGPNVMNSIKTESLELLYTVNSNNSLYSSPNIIEVKNDAVNTTIGIR